MNSTNPKLTMKSGKNETNFNMISIKERLLHLEQKCHLLNDDTEIQLKELIKVELGLNEDIKPYLGGPKIAYKETSEQISRLENQIDKHFNHQKSENCKMEKDIDDLKNDNTCMEQNLIDIDRQLDEIHNKIGKEYITQ